MSNFDFLKQTQIFNSFADASIEAENGIGLNTVTCSILSRRALEIAVKWLYANDMELKTPYQDNSQSKGRDCLHTMKSYL